MNKAIFFFLLFSTFSFSRVIHIPYVKGFVDKVVETKRPDLTAPVPIKWHYKAGEEIHLFQAHRDMCVRKPDSVMCKDQLDNTNEVSDLDVLLKATELYENFTYKKDVEVYGYNDYWNHNDSVSEKLVGDCEDISITFISQLIKDGVSADRIRLVLKAGDDGIPVHAYVQVFLWDGSIYKFFDYDKPGIKDYEYVQMDHVFKYIAIK